MLKRKDREIPFRITISFLSAFVVIRVLVFIAGSAHSKFAQAAKLGQPPGVKFAIGKNLILFGYHIHHFYVGVALMAIAGWAVLMDSRRIPRKTAAILYGAGLGLFMDEIGLLLTWGDYFSSLSYLLILLVSVVFLNIIFFPGFWTALRGRLIDGRTHSVVADSLPRDDAFVRIGDKISGLLGRTESTTLAFAGFLSIVVCTLMLLLEGFLRYWVCGIFLIQGLTHLVRIFSGDTMKPKYERTILAVTGLAYIAGGVLSLLFEDLLEYLVAGIFAIHGLSQIFRAIRGADRAPATAIAGGKKGK